MAYDAQKVDQILESLATALPDAHVTTAEDFEKTAQRFTVSYQGKVTHRIWVEKSGFERYSADKILDMLDEEAVERLKHPSPEITVWISDIGISVS